ncbi:MAG: DUF6220 domain-containing protein [Candidatus Dormibacteria bacterium]
MLRRAYTVLGILLLVELALQFFLIAAAALIVWGADNNAQSVYSAFKTGDGLASLHAISGTLLIPGTILVMILIAFAARLPRRAAIQTVGLFVLMVLQFLLGAVGSSGTSVAIIGGLHGINALAIVGLAVSLLIRNWGFGGSRGVAAETAAGSR